MFKNMTSDLSSFCAADRWCNHCEGGDGSRVCVCPWEGSLAMVSWSKLIRFDKVPIAVYHPEYELSISQSYQTRIQFLKTTPMDGSITITNVTQEDTGVYHCSVQTFPRGSWARDILV